MAIPSARKQLEDGISLIKPSSSSRSALSRFELGTAGSVVRQAWEGPEPVGFPYLWNLSQYYFERNIDTFTFNEYGDGYVVCLCDGGGPVVWTDPNGVYSGRITLARLWISAANLSLAWRLLFWPMEQRGLITAFAGGALQMTPAMTLDEANQLGMRYVQILNYQGSPGIGAMEFDYSEWVRNNRGAPPPVLADILQGRTILA